MSSCGVCRVNKTGGNLNSSKTLCIVTLEKQKAMNQLNCWKCVVLLASFYVLAQSIFH